MQLTRLAARGLIAAGGLIVGALIALAPSAAFAATQQDFAARTTGDLADLCSADPHSPMGEAAVNFCHGFAQGAVTVEMEHQEASPNRPKLFCFPNPAPTRTATLNEFVKWAQSSPAHLQDRAADGLFSFLQQRFPCGKS